MNHREIPGYYFDRQKERYFKIQKASDAPRPDSRYNEESVKKEQRRHRRQEIEIEISRRRQRRIYKQRISPNLSFLNREIGHRSGTHYIQNSWPGACAAGYDSQIRLLQMPPPTRYFDHDPLTHNLYVAASSVVRRLQPHPVIDPGSTNSSCIYHESTELVRLTSEISSIHYLSASGAMVATSLGGTRPPVIYLSDPDHDGPYIGEQITPVSATTIYTSAPLPSAPSTPNSVAANATEHVAVAASRELMMLSRGQSSTWNASIINKAPSDILSLEWLSDTTLAYGLRDGNIHIYDRRSGGSTKVLWHPTPATHLRRADDFTRLVCKGLQNTLMLYDMRMAKAEQVKPPPRKKQRYDFWQPQWKHSQALITFPYVNEDDNELGIDVHARLGLVAAADEDAKVSLWSLWDGDKVKEFPKAHRKYGQGVGKTRCLRFIEDDGGSGGVSLWSVRDGNIVRFGW